MYKRWREVDKLLAMFAANRRQERSQALNLNQDVRIFFLSYFTIYSTCY